MILLYITFRVSDTRVHLSPGGTLDAINSLCSVIFLVFSVIWIYINVMMLEEKKSKIIELLPSTWTEHMDFADWLVRYKRPKVVVELGVDFGYSTCSFALSGIGTIYAIDWFKGDEYTGFRDNYEFVKKHLELFECSNVNLMNMSFEEALADWHLPIDILHIDGFHTYDAVCNDYMEWTRFLNSGGVVLIHDTCIDWFGVKVFFDQITTPKLNFKVSCGLGVVTADTVLLGEIRKNFADKLDSRY